jgi:hypothetical protein
MSWFKDWIYGKKEQKITQPSHGGGHIEIKVYEEELFEEPLQVRVKSRVPRNATPKKLNKGLVEKVKKKNANSDTKRK